MLQRLSCTGPDGYQDILQYSQGIVVPPHHFGLAKRSDSLGVMMRMHIEIYDGAEQSNSWVKVPYQVNSGL